MSSNWDSMVKSVQVKRVVKGSIPNVWAIISDFENVHLINPYVVSTRILSDHSRGLHASRRCEMNDNTYVEEKVTTWIENKQLTVQQLHFHAVKESEITIFLSFVSKTKTEISFIFKYIRKNGIFGWFEEQITLRWFMKRVFNRISQNIEIQASIP